jgi:ABC-type oligopeptide transport system substrate-binding subunit
MATIFCKKGGSGIFTKLAGELNSDQLSVIQDQLGGETPVIASVRSRDEWFVLTVSRFVQQRHAVRRTTLLDVVDDIVAVGGFAKAKAHGGTLAVRLRDESTLEIELESGRPYFAVMNVFLSLARVNRKAGGNLSRPRARANDEQPTTQL